MNRKVAIIGYGYVGKAFNKVFPEAVIYDEPQKIGTREEANSCGLALVVVPTNLQEDGTLDISIVEDVVSWLETDCILIKSAVMPGTVDALKEKYPDKKIAVSVEMVGEGKYHVPFWKYPHPQDPTLHQFLIVGGTTEDANMCAEFFWEKLSPSIDIHIVTALEAEICKLMENFWGAMKVTFANEVYKFCQLYGANYIRVLQAWGSDGRTEKMHMRVTEGKQGWKSKCWDKDIPAFYTSMKNKGYESLLAKAVIASNEKHLSFNKKAEKPPESVVISAIVQEVQRFLNSSSS